MTPGRAGPLEGAKLVWNSLLPSPLAKGAAHSLALMLLAAFAICPVGLASAFALRVNPLLTLVPLLLAAGAAVTAVDRRRSLANALEVRVRGACVRFAGRHGALEFWPQTTRAALEARQWHSPRTTGHNAWTVLTLTSPAAELTVGTPSLLAAPSGRTGQPMYTCDEATLRALAAHFNVVPPG